MTTAREQLKELILKDAVIHGKVTLSSGKEADYYVDLRRVTLGATAAPLVGQVMLETTKDLDFDAAGGLTMGADPIGIAIMHQAHAAGRAVDAFVVRKAAKAHGMQKQIEGPEISGRNVLIVEDTSTTGNSPLTAAKAAKAAGANVVGVAVIVDRDSGAREVIENEGFAYYAAFSSSDLGLS